MAKKKSNLKQILATNLKERRQKCGLTQAQLAEKVNVSTHHIAMIEIARNYPTLELLERIANVLEIEVFELFKGSLVPSDNKEIMSQLSKEITEKINSSVSDIFKQYLG